MYHGAVHQPPIHPTPPQPHGPNCCLTRSCVAHHCPIAAGLPHDGCLLQHISPADSSTTVCSTVTATHDCSVVAQLLPCRHRAAPCRGLGHVPDTCGAHQACTLCASCFTAGQGCQESCRLLERPTAFEHAMLHAKRKLQCFPPALMQFCICASIHRRTRNQQTASAEMHSCDCRLTCQH